jgi:hypothetical protein
VLTFRVEPEAGIAAIAQPATDLAQAQRKLSEMQEQQAAMAEVQRGVNA